MENPVMQVFNSKDLRHCILSKILEEKYHKEIHDFVMQLIVEKWYKYCNCFECRYRRRIEQFDE